MKRKEGNEMKKKRIWMLLVLVVILTGCGAGRREARERERAEAAERLLEGKVEVPDTYFKTQEAVEALFEAAGLKVEFVVSNFDDKASINERFLRAGECDDIDSSQAAVTYFSSDEVGDLYGYYADIGATIIVGYSDHDYDGTAGEEIEESEVVEENIGDDVISDEEIAIESDSKRVSYTVESEYEKGTYGYKWDEERAKTEAIKEQAPDEYADYIFLLESLSSFREPYIWHLDNSRSTEEQKESERGEVKSIVHQAKNIKERLDEITRTVNNAEEYEELSARVLKGLSFEVHLEE